MARKQQLVRIYRVPARRHPPGSAGQQNALPPKAEKPLHLKWRALLDLVPLAGAVVLTRHLLPAADNLSLIVTFGIFLLGIALYLARRNADFARFAEQRARLAERTEGLGMPLADWQQGATLLPWAERVAERVAERASPSPASTPAPESASNDSTRAVDHESL